jgi:hypothetical protein
VLRGVSAPPEVIALAALTIERVPRSADTAASH